MFSGGGGGDGSRAVFSGMWHRVRLLALAFAWACSMFLVVRGAGSLLVWLDHTLGISRSLGYGPGITRQTQHSVCDDSEELVEMVSVDAGVPSVVHDVHGGGDAATVMAEGTAATVVPGQTDGLDHATQAHLELLKDYERRKAATSMGGMDLASHATAAYFMILGTMGLFFFVYK
jgi:hypothetical protein